MLHKLSIILLAGLSVLACSDSTGLDGESGLTTVGFATRSATGGGAGVSVPGPGLSILAVEGTNGTLDITSVFLVVDELELEGSDDACLKVDDDDDPDDEPGEAFEDCAEFETGPFLLALPLTGDGIVQVATENVAVGSYSAFEFEVEDVELDEEGDDDEEADELIALRDDLRAVHPDWPDEASMVVEGTFTPADGGEARTFRTFVEAEIEIEMPLVPPLVVVADEQVEITVVLDPAMWFTRGDGSLIDLSVHDFTGSEDDLLELEAEFEDGVIEIEIDDD